MKKVFKSVIVFLLPLLLNAGESKTGYVDGDNPNANVAFSTDYATFYTISGSPTGGWVFTDHFGISGYSGWYKSAAHSAKCEKIVINDIQIATLWIDAATAFGVSINGKMYKPGGGGSLVDWRVTGSSSAAAINMHIDSSTAVVAVGNSKSFAYKKADGVQLYGLWWDSSKTPTFSINNYSSTGKTYSFSSNVAGQYYVEAARNGVGDKSATATVNVIKIDTETAATIPVDRTRKKLGVGENVTLTLKPTGLSPITWSKSGNGTLSSTSGGSVTFTAHDRASTPSVTATYEGVPVTVNFTIVEPSGVIFEQEPGTGIFHDYGIFSVGFRGRPYITPADVSFDNISIREGTCNAEATGYFAFWDGLSHAASSWKSVGSVVVNKGSMVNVLDTIEVRVTNTPHSAGSFIWPIPWLFKVGEGAEKTFATVNHEISSDATGKATISKGGTTKSKELNDPDSTYY